MTDKHSPLLTRNAAHATWWAGLEIASRYVVRFVVMIALARLLTPRDFGLIAMLLVFTGIAALLVDGGFGTALVQKQHPSNDDETTVFVCSLGISLAAAIALWAAAPAIASFYAQPILTGVMRVLALVLPLSALATVPNALLTQRLDFHTRTLIEGTAAVSAGILAIFLAWRGMGLWSLVWQALADTGIRALLSWVLAGWRPRGRISGASFRDLFGFGGYMLLSNLLNVIAIRLQSLLIGKQFNASTLGYYTMAQDTSMVPAQIINGLLSRVGLPIFSAVSSQAHKFTGALKLALHVSLFVFTPIIVIIAVLAKPLVIVVYGQPWTHAAPLLSVLALSTLLWPVHVLNLTALGAQGRSDLFFRLELAKFVVSVILVVPASFFGALAVALAVLTTSLVSVFINTWYSHRLLDYGLTRQMGDQVATLALAVLAGGIAWCVAYWLHGALERLLGALIAASSGYLGLALLCRHSAIGELMELFHAWREGPANMSK